MVFHKLSNAIFKIILLQTLAKIKQKENGKLKTMSQLFFIFWNHSNIFCNFSGCRCPIFNCFYIIIFVFPLAFQRCISNCSTTKTREATAKTIYKVENDGEERRGMTKYFGVLLYSFITRGLFKKQDMVLTFWIGSQNVEKRIEKGIFSK